MLVVVASGRSFGTSKVSLGLGAGRGALRLHLDVCERGRDRQRQHGGERRQRASHCTAASSLASVPSTRHRRAPSTFSGEST